MFGRLFKKNPHTEQRAQALIAGFLKRHRELISVKAFARHMVANIDDGGVNAALKGFGPMPRPRLATIHSMRFI